MVVCVFLVVVGVVIGLYTVASAVLGKQHFMDCKEQLIENGVIMRSVVNGTAQIKCDDGYDLKAPPKMELRCHLISKKCVVLRPATQSEEAMRKCDEKYVFTLAEDAEQLDPDTGSEQVQAKVEHLREFAYTQTTGLCVMPGVEPVSAPGNASRAEAPDEAATASAQRLFGKQEVVTQLPAGQVSPTWSTAASTACLLALVLVALGALVGSAASRGRQGRGRRVDREPDTAALLEDVSECGACEAASP